LKIGNPVHAILLSVVAVGAILFFVMRLIPARPGGPVAATTGSPTNSGRVLTPSALPREILRDAFSNPELTKHALASLDKDKKPDEKGAEESQDESQSPLIGLLPTDPKFSFQQVEAAQKSGNKPSESAGITRDKESKSTSSIELKGIMRVKTPLALMTIEGHQDVTVALGEYVTTDYRLTGFRQDAVRLTSKHGSSWLFVGSKVNEK
jgi:hypothetical protein